MYNLGNDRGIFNSLKKNLFAHHLNLRIMPARIVTHFLLEQFSVVLNQVTVGHWDALLLFHYLMGIQLLCRYRFQRLHKDRISPYGSPGYYRDKRTRFYGLFDRK